MELLLLGTSACDPTPNPWCSCRVCDTARRQEGREIRRRSSYLINNDTLVDFGPDINWQCNEFKLDLRRIKRFVITHSHYDHLNPTSLFWRRNAKLKSYAKLFSNQEVIDHILKVCNQEARALGMRKDISFDDLFLKSYRALPGNEINDKAMKILPIKAAHVKDETALNYLFTGNDGKKLFIINDTGWWTDESWQLVENSQADAVLIEVTSGIGAQSECRSAHLGANAAISFIERLRNLNALTSEAQIVATHISHTSGATHHDLENYLKDSGILVGFDGMKLNF